MKQVVVNIPENKFKFFMELIKSLGFIKVEEKNKDNVLASKNAIINNVKQGLKEVQWIEKRKMKSTSLKDFMNEL
jgi:hypothetical protein